MAYLRSSAREHRSIASAVAADSARTAIGSPATWSTPSLVAVSSPIPATADALHGPHVDLAAAVDDPDDDPMAGRAGRSPGLDLDLEGAIDARKLADVESGHG